MNKVTYEIRFREIKDNSSKTVGGRELDTKKEAEVKLQTNEQITNTAATKSFQKVIGAAATTYGLSQVVVNPLITNATNKAALKGDYVQAKNIQRTQAKVNMLTNMGFQAAGIAVAFMTAGPIGGAAAIGATAISYGSKIINAQQQNEMMMAQNETDQYVKSYDSARFADIRKRG